MSKSKLSRLIEEEHGETQAAARAKEEQVEKVKAKEKATFRQVFEFVCQSELGEPKYDEHRPSLYWTTEEGLLCFVPDIDGFRPGDTRTLAMDEVYKSRHFFCREYPTVCIARNKKDGQFVLSIRLSVESSGRLNEPDYLSRARKAQHVAVQALGLREMFPELKDAPILDQAREVLLQKSRSTLQASWEEAQRLLAEARDVLEQREGYVRTLEARVRIRNRAKEEERDENA
jgi:hypothetical protein